MKNPVIGFAGMTHLGINSAAAAAARGFPTLGFDPDTGVIARLSAGELPVSEPDLDRLIADNRERITWSADWTDLGRCDVLYVACDVPTDDQGTSDLVYVRTLIAKVIPHLALDATLVVLCQVPPGFTRALEWPHGQLYYQVETLIFGRAVERALHPERFIVGSAEPSRALPEPYREFLAAFDCPLLPMRYESAELAKIAINCCLVASVTVANTLAELSERIGADWHEIVPALKLDKRIGQYSYLSPGLGLAGGNLERDLSTVLSLAGESGSDAALIEAFVSNSRHRSDWALRALHREVFSCASDPVVAILGLTYKENTHSTKNSPALALIRHLSNWQLRVYDPVVAADVVHHPRVAGCGSALEAASAADALVVMTAWPQFRAITTADLARVMRGHVVIDPYRILEGAALSAAGFDYVTLGVPPLRAYPKRALHA